MLRVQHYPGFKQVLIAADIISRLAVIEISSVGPGYVDSYGTNPQNVVGVAAGDALSGQPIKAVTHGLVSGVICASAVNAGDRVGSAVSGQIQSLNTIPVSGFVPAPLLDLISGGVGSGSIVMGASRLACTSGLQSGLTGIRAPQFGSGLALTGLVLGRALGSGGVGSGIQVMVEVE